MKQYLLLKSVLNQCLLYILNIFQFDLFLIYIYTKFQPYTCKLYTTKPNAYDQYKPVHY